VYKTPVNQNYYKQLYIHYKNLNIKLLNYGLAFDSSKIHIMFLLTHNVSYYTSVLFFNTVYSKFSATLLRTFWKIDQIWFKAI